MIIETHNYALKIVQGNEVEILKAVIYESEHDIPSGLIGFETEQQMLGYIDANGLKEYDPNALPTADWLKADIQNWLTQNEITWTTSQTKAQLLQLVP